MLQWLGPSRGVGLPRAVSAMEVGGIEQTRRTTMSDTKTMTGAINGVDRDRLLETVDQIKASPGLAKFRFSLGNKWVDGGHNRSTVKGFYGAGTEIEHAVKFELDADEPAILLG